MSRPRREQFAAVVVLAGLGAFWTALLLAGAASSGYSQRRDYVSSLAAHGVDDAWLGMLAIAAIGVVGLGAAVLVRPLTRAGALALACAGIGFVVVALVRIDCPNGAARCGLGGRFDVHGAPAITHWTAAVASTVFVLAGATFVAYALFRRGRRGGEGRERRRGRGDPRRPARDGRPVARSRSASLDRRDDGVARRCCRGRSHPRVTDATDGRGGRVESGRPSEAVRTGARHDEGDAPSPERDLERAFPAAPVTPCTRATRRPSRRATSVTAARDGAARAVERREGDAGAARRDTDVDRPDAERGGAYDDGRGPGERAGPGGHGPAAEHAPGPEPHGAASAHDGAERRRRGRPGERRGSGIPEASVAAPVNATSPRARTSRAPGVTVTRAATPAATTTGRVACDVPGADAVRVAARVSR